MIFQFTDDEQHTVRHTPSGMVFQILLNPVDGRDYDAWNDTYQEFEFRGNKIISLMVNADEYEPEPMPVGFQKIHAINRKAFKFFKSKVFIESYTRPDGEWETDRYLLQQQENGKDWLLTDKDSLLVILWENKRFNETQKIIPLEDFETTGEPFSLIPKILRAAADWLSENHPNKI